MEEKNNKFPIPWWIWVISILLIVSASYYDFYVTVEHKPDFIIKVLPIIFGLFAIYLTVRRMGQTKEQIDVMSDNNKFNNFYKHRDMFSDYMRKTEIIKILEKYADVSTNQLLNIYYRVFYKTDYKEFIAKISSKGKTQIDGFIESLRNSKINTEPIFKSENIDQVIIDLYDDVKSFITIYIGSASTNILKQKGKWENIIDSKNEPIELLAIRKFFDIYFSYYIIFEILSFDGKEKLEKYACITFSHNVTRILQHNNFAEILIPSLKELDI